MSYWIFQCDPERYRLEDRLRDPTPQISWTVNQHKDEIGWGHTAFLWASGLEGGLLATMEIETYPKKMLELENERQYWNDLSDTGQKLRVLGRITRRDIRIRRAELKKVPELEELSILRFAQGTNFRVSATEAGALIRMINKARELRAATAI